MSVLNIDSISRNVQKVNDGFYVGQFPGQDLRLVMERVDSTNIQSWNRYADIQTDSRVHNYVLDNHTTRDTNGHLVRPPSLITGSGHFNEVLKTVDYSVNEVWIAYVTKAGTPEKIPDMTHYSGDNAVDKDHPFAKNIEMFVTVTSSPDALITTHMGVAGSLESVGNRSKGISVDLHSFAAKVMLLRNPTRKYMVNTPADSMEMIFAKALPGSFHAGTIEMQEKMKKRQDISMDEFANVILPKQSKKIQEIAKTNPDDMRVMKAQLLEKFSLDKKYHFYKNPYPFPSAKDQNMAGKEFLEFMEKHPPILSKQKDRMVIFNPQTSESDITIMNGCKGYEFMNKRVFKPVGSTHYVAVDLLALATSKELGPN